MELTYNRVLQLLVIAYSNSKNIASKIHVKKQPITLRFSDYVKSQLHLNVISGYYAVSKKRNIYEYEYAMEFLEGDSSQLQAARRVLSYFYEDMSSFLIKNNEEIQLSIIVDVDLRIASEQVMFDGAKQQLLGVLGAAVSQNNSIQDVLTEHSQRLLKDVPKYTSILESVKQFEYADILDVIQVTPKNINKICDVINNFVMACVMRKYAMIAQNSNIYKEVIIK